MGYASKADDSGPWKPICPKNCPLKRLQVILLFAFAIIIKIVVRAVVLTQYFLKYQFMNWKVFLDQETSYESLPFTNKVEREVSI